MNKIRSVLVILLLIPLTIQASSMTEFCKELGRVSLERGDIEQARIEYTKVITIDPFDREAQQVLAQIRQDRIDTMLDAFEPAPASSQPAWRRPSPADRLHEKRPSVPVKEEGPVPSGLVEVPVVRPADRDKETDPVWKKFKVKGVYQTAIGVTSEDLYWKRSNYELNERNWRVLSRDALNNRENTYDPAVFSQFQFSVDYPQEKGWSFHSFFDVSPWSFIGKSDKVTLTAANGDTAEIELKYWSGSGYALNEIYYTDLKGDSFNLPELKVNRGRVLPTTVTTTWGTTFDVPELKLHHEFQPIREIEFAYNNDNVSLDIFPWATDAKSYTSDDPLRLSNNMTYWEESQWLVKWRPGHFNSDPAARDYQPGWWDDSTAFAARDAGNVRLTALRGMNLSYEAGNTTIDFAVSSPKEPWQDYGEINALNNALRARYKADDDLTIGALYGAKWGYDEESVDAVNHILGIDANYGISDDTQLYAELATSCSEYDKKSAYSTEKRGNALHLQLVNSSANRFGKTYFELLPEKKEFLYRARLSFTHMDEGFESALSSYRFTRNDAFWGRHLTFKDPFHMFIPALRDTSVSWHDIKDFRIGNGIDYGRDVISARYEAFNLLDARLDFLFDTRNVHDVNGKYIENVTRAEATYKPDKKWTHKVLGIYHDLPKTKGGIDPFLFDPLTGEPYKDWSSDAIDDGKDPSLKTISAGSEYWFTDWLAANAILEMTNDCTLAYDNYPRGLFNDSQPSNIWSMYGYTFRSSNPFLYDQQYFNQPPYPWYNIYKLGLKIKPSEKTNVALNYTRNEYEWAQSIDDNMNHIGLDIEHMINEKWSAHFWYTYSRAKSISRLIDDGIVDVEGHHNIFFELGFMPGEESRFRLMYGIGNMAYYASPNFNPYGGFPVLDTEHILRIIYERKF